MLLVTQVGENGCCALFWRKEKYNENSSIFLKWHFFTTSPLPEHSYTLFRVRKQTFFLSVDIFGEWENSSCGQEKALLPLFSRAADHLCHGLSLEALGTSVGRWEQVLAAGWREQPLSAIWMYALFWWLGWAMVIYSLHSGVHAWHISANGRKSPFSMSFSHKAATGLDSHIAELVASSGMASPVFAMLWPLELPLKQM